LKLCIIVVMKKVYSIILIAAVIFLIILIVFPYQKREAKILFVGDMFFDRYIRLVEYNKGEDFTFSCISNFLGDSDLVVGNLEGPITDNPSTSLGTVPGGDGNYNFTFPARIANLLYRNNIKLVNLGNNHIGNLGTSGVESTKKFLDEARVRYFGGVSGDDDVYRTEIGGTKMSFVSFNEFGQENVQQVAQKISAEKKNGQTVIVYAHWGDEYATVPQRLKDTAKLFAQSGATFIIGSHPHIILPSEKISTGSTSSLQAATVYYSLGNFIFDQYWNKEVSTGLVLEFDIKGKLADWKIIEHKVSLNRDGRTCLEN